MSTPATFEKRSAPIAFDKALGLCFGWFAFSKKDGQPYVDSHGDHFPDDEFVKAVDALMALPASEREINVEHAGGGRGVIATAQALTEDIAKAMGIDTGGTYGIVGSFRPDAALMKSIAAGEMFCLSIEGSAADVETIAKSVGGIAASAHKRTMRAVTLTKLAVVKAGAHEGAAVAIVKTATDAARLLVATQVAKRQHALTSVVDGHQHVLYDVDDPDLKYGSTSYESEISGYGHSHSWIRNIDGAIEIALTNGHTHPLTDSTESTMPTDLEKTQADTITKSAARIGSLSALLLTAASLPPEQAAYAKRLAPDQLEGFLAQAPSERATVAAPIHKSDRTGRLFYAGDEALVEFAKDADATHVELAKARDAGKVEGFAKTATKIACNVAGGLDAGTALVKAIAGEKLSEAEQKLATDALTAANAALGTVLKSVGHSSVAEVTGATSQLDNALAAFAKAKGVQPYEAAAEFSRTDEARALYAAAYPVDVARA